MKISMIIDSEGTIKGFSTIGGIVGGVEIELSDETDLSILLHARWDGEKLIEILPTPVKVPEQPIEQRMSDLETAFATLAFGGGTT